MEEITGSSQRLGPQGVRGRAVLTGGACATIYSDGAYVSHDLDFIIQSGPKQQDLERAPGAVGFTRHGDRYVHRSTRFFVEFPRGPLAVADDTRITPVLLALGRGRTMALLATDSCRDRLAAFYHWSDRQSLQAAIEIARRHRVNMRVIERWSRREGHAERFREFQSHTAGRRRVRR